MGRDALFAAAHMAVKLQPAVEVRNTRCVCALRGDEQAVPDAVPMKAPLHVDVAEPLLPSW